MKRKTGGTGRLLRNDGSQIHDEFKLKGGARQLTQVPHKGSPRSR